MTRALRHRYGRAATRSGRLTGVGRIAGRRMAYVRWDGGATEEFTLSEFRKRFGVSASSLPAGAPVMEIR